MDNWKTRKDHSGFTLMEMLIVVAMIAVLVAISIPIFTNILEKSRESTDLANVRSAYAECWQRPVWMIRRMRRKPWH